MGAHQTNIPMTKLAHCPWCAAPFISKKVGAHRKRFCSARCRNRYHAAARKWVQKAIGVGLLSIVDLKAAEASCTRRGVAEAGAIRHPSTRSQRALKPLRADLGGDINLNIPGQRNSQANPGYSDNAQTTLRSVSRLSIGTAAPILQAGPEESLASPRLWSHRAVGRY